MSQHKAGDKVVTVTDVVCTLGIDRIEVHKGTVGTVERSVKSRTHVNFHDGNGPLALYHDEIAPHYVGPDDPRLLLKEFQNDLAGLQEYLSEYAMYTGGCPVPGALMAKIAYMMTQAATKARAYAEKTPL